MAIRPEYAKRVAIHQFKVRRFLGKNLFPHPQNSHEVKTAVVANSLYTTEVKVEKVYLNAVEAIVAATGQRTEKIKVLVELLPQALAISEAEIGALLVVGDHITPQNGKVNNLIVITWQEMPAEVIKQLTGGALAKMLLAGQRIWLQPQALPSDTEQALLGRHKIKYLLGLPLLADGEVLGAIVVGSRKANNSLISWELQQQLSMLAQLMALFLDNIRLRTRQRQLQVEMTQKQVVVTASDGAKDNDLEDLLAAVMSAEEEVANQNRDLGLLNALSGEIGSTLQLSAILEAAVSQTTKLLQVEKSWCYLLENDQLVLREQRGLSTDYVNGMKYLEPGSGVEGMAFSRKQPILRDGLLFHSGKARNLTKDEGLRMIAAVPLTAQGHTFGVLAAAKHHQQSWSARDERMLMSIGRQVAQAIGNSHMLTDVQAKAQTLESSFSTLQQTNVQLQRRAELLERQLQEFRRTEKQIWTMLAASTEARRKIKSANANDEELLGALKRVLVSIAEKSEA
jgi:GAF domain-containing protein